MRQSENAKRTLVLCLDFLNLLLQTGVYAWFWLQVYYPLLQKPRISVQGYALGGGLKLYFRGHLLVLAIYFILLAFFANTYGSLKVGHLRPMEIFFAQIFALVMVNILSYGQISLMNNWLVPIEPMVRILILQLAVAFLWAYLSTLLYRSLFKPRELLLVSGAYPVDDIVTKFSSREDRYVIRRKMTIADGFDAICEEAENGYGGVVLWDIPTPERNRLLKHCYSKRIRVYVMPKISDVLTNGSDHLHLFDTPIYLIREYSMKPEQALIKRAIDVICSLILIVLTSPLMLLTALAVRLYDHGPVLYKQIRCTEDAREFRMIKFRSMRVDAEKDGVARLAAKNDDRITPVGKFIRACRLDELPQLFNILKGDMSFIGPRPERPSIIAQYMETMPEFAYRMRVKAGLAGYAQVYGKYNTTPYDKLKLDLTYIQNYSVWLDIKLMLLTLKILFTPDSTEGVDSSQTTALKQQKG